MRVHANLNVGDYDENSFQHVFQIYTKDIRNIVTNWVVAVIIGGLIFLPSLYAWLNIYASMDPYAHL